jgi:hypothetical protein
MDCVSSPAPGNAADQVGQVYTCPETISQRQSRRAARRSYADNTDLNIEFVFTGKKSSSVKEAEALDITG